MVLKFYTKNYTVSSLTCI